MFTTYHGSLGPPKAQFTGISSYQRWIPIYLWQEGWSLCFSAEKSLGRRTRAPLMAFPWAHSSFSCLWPWDNGGSRIQYLPCPVCRHAFVVCFSVLSEWLWTPAVFHSPKRSCAVWWKETHPSLRWWRQVSTHNHERWIKSYCVWIGDRRLPTPGRRGWTESRRRIHFNWPHRRPRRWPDGMMCLEGILSSPS
jgi:hypothetical protein